MKIFESSEANSQFFKVLCVSVGVYGILKFSIYVRNINKRNEFYEKFHIPMNDRIFGINEILTKNKESEYAKTWRIDYIIKNKLSNWVFKLSPFFKILMVADPELARFLMNLNPSFMRKAGFSDAAFGDDPNGLMASILFLEGNEWHRARKLIGKNFSLQDLNSYIENMDESALKFVEILSRNRNKFIENSYLKELCKQFSYETIAKNIMGDSDCNLLEQNGDSAAYRATHLILGGLGWKQANMLKLMLIHKIPFGLFFAKYFVDPLGKMHDGFATRDKYLDDIIKLKRKEIAAGAENTDLASLLLRAKNDDGSPTFTVKEIRAHIYTFQFGAYDTTSSAVENIMFHLGNEPEWKNKIKIEFNELGNVIDENTLRNMKITTAFVKEILRVSNVVNHLIPRVLLKNLELPNGVVMPAGCQYAIDVTALSQNHAWGDKAMEFNPARFLDNSEKMHPYQNIPFSAGKRNCIGRNFAMQEMKILTIRVATHLNLENEMVESDRYGRPVKKLIFTYQPKNNTYRQKITACTA